MMTWYMDISKYKTLLMYLLFWMSTVLMLVLQMPFQFMHIYVPIIYPIMLFIFLTLHSTHPHIMYLYEIRKKHRWILFKEWLHINIISDIKMIILACLHVIVITLFTIDIPIMHVLTLSMSALFIFKMFHILMHGIFYKIMIFMVYYVCHFFLLDHSLYLELYFLFNSELNLWALIYMYGISYALQCLHFVGLEKKVY